MSKFVVRPSFKGDVLAGSEGTGSKVYIGQVGETGPRRKVYFNSSSEFVTMILGKRGSGKSHALGALLEGLAAKEPESCLGEHQERKAVLLIDPMGNFWTTKIPVTAHGSAKIREFHKQLKAWDLETTDVNVNVWIPAGTKTINDPAFVREFTVQISELDLPALADLLSLNLMRDPQGAALTDAFIAVTEDGWVSGQVQKHPKANYSIGDLLNYLEELRDNGDGGDHSPSTIRALIRSLRHFQHSPVFSGTGTPLTELLQPGWLSILMLPHRVGSDLRRVLTRLLIKRILREREEASQIKQRLDIEELPGDERARLIDALESRVPKSIVAIDEAQELLGDDSGEARKALEDFCLLGRNYGLSMILATQRPSTAAISAKVRSQVDCYIVHRLLTQDDIETIWSNLLTIWPEEVRLGDNNLDFASVVRALSKGQAILSASNAIADTPVPRAIIVDIRPRVTVHGGEVS